MTICYNTGNGTINYIEYSICNPQLFVDSANFLHRVANHCIQQAYFTRLYGAFFRVGVRGECTLNKFTCDRRPAVNGQSGGNVNRFLSPITFFKVNGGKGAIQK